MRRLGLLVALVSAACAPHARPSTPAPPVPIVLTAHVNEPNGSPVIGARVFWSGGLSATTDVFGRASIATFAPARFGFCAEAVDHLTQCLDTELPAKPDQFFTLTSTKPPVVILDGKERGPLHRDRTLFRRADGSIFPWVGASDFALFARYTRGEDIGPILNERIALGFNILRVFGMFDRFGIGGPQASGLGTFTPATTTNYYPKLRAFVELTQSRGVRVEIVVLADADERSDGTGGLLPTLAEQQTHLTLSLAALTGTWGATVNWANEAFKNAARVEQLRGDCRVAGVLCTYGTKLPDGDIPTVWPILDYLEPHDHERKEEWPRTARGYGEIVDALQAPVVANEPIGYAEVARPGSRAVDPNDAAYFAATMQMFASGSTFHSDDGVASRLFRPVQLAAAKAWAFGARWVPPEAQLAPYQRGGECGSSGIGNMPLEHCDLGTGAPQQALRTFCKTINGVAYCVRIRPVGPAIPRGGWGIRDQPRLGFVTLTR